MVWNQSPSVQVSCLMTNCHLISRKKLLVGPSIATPLGRQNISCIGLHSKFHWPPLAGKITYRAYLGPVYMQVQSWPGGTEIRNQCGHRLALHQDIARFEVPVHDVITMQMRQTLYKTPANTFALHSHTVVLLMYLCKSVS